MTDKSSSLDLTPARPGRGRRHRFQAQMVWEERPGRAPEPFELWHRKTKVLHLVCGYESSSAILASLLDRAVSLGSGIWSAVFSSDLADVLASMGRHQEAMPHAQRALGIFEELGDERGQAGALHHLGRIYDDRSETGSSADCYRRLLEISERTGQHDLMMQALYALQDNFERDYIVGRYIGILDEAKASGEKHRIAQALFYLEDLYLNAGEWPRAEEYNRALYRTAREIGDRLGMSYAIGDRGLILDAQGRHHEAIDCFREKLEISESMGDFYNVFEALNNLGASHMMAGDNRTAEEYFSRAAAHAGRHQVKRHLCSALQYQAHCLLELGQHRRASEVNAEALRVAREAGVDEVVFHGRLLEARLEALDDAPKAAGMLRALLTEAGDEEARADVLRELYAITGDESHRSRAISDYRRHYEKTKLHYLLTRIKELAEDGNESGSREGL